MKTLRGIRIFLSVLFFAAAAAYTLSPPPVRPLAAISPHTQIIPSMIAFSMGAILFWLAMTYCFGRIYCASFCPIGAIQDAVIFVRRKATRRVATRRTGRYRPHNKAHYHILLIYVITVFAGLVAVPYLIEPWNIFCNISSVIRPSAVEATWLRLGTGAVAGIVAGVVSLTAVVIWAWVADRDFCNRFCPVGTALGLLDNHSLMHIEIDPDKCLSCLKCEEHCRSGCIKVVSRYVDNSRCVRCFDCISVCENNAVRFQINRNRPASPLSKRASKTT